MKKEEIQVPFNKQEIQDNGKWVEFAGSMAIINNLEFICMDCKSARA